MTAFKLHIVFVTTLKSNRLVSVRKESGYQHLEIAWNADQLQTGRLVKLKELPFLVPLFKILASNGDIEWMITNRNLSADDLNHQARSTADDIQHENAVRWQIEQMLRELKQLVGSEKCQYRKARSQRNHLAC